VLQVRRDGHWEAAAFFSRQLRGAEQRYSATEMEALAMVAAVEHFADYLYGHAFTIYTDHKPLTHLLDSDRLNPRLRRLGYKLQGWMVWIEYLPGQENGFADAFSREERARARPDLGKDVYGMRNQKELENAGILPDIRLARGDVEGTPPLEKIEH